MSQKEHIILDQCWFRVYYYYSILLYSILLLLEYIIIITAHACNPSYSGGRDQEDSGLKPTRQIVLKTLSPKGEVLGFKP
jgi:hypothetical protein